MKPRHRLFLKLNLMSLFVIAVSFISVTLAWFAYSGLSKVSTEIGVKAWYIELQKDGQKISNDIVISLSEIYPGMNVVTEKYNIKNLGDSDAQVKYSIVSARVLGDPSDNFIVNEDTIKSDYVEDLLSHEYPFHININLSKNYILAKGDESTFEVSISWPLDSDNDVFDSEWGTNAYNFQIGEEDKKNIDPEYQIKPSIQVVISLTAEQYLEVDTSSDRNYNVGDSILYDVESNHSCEQLSSSCINTYVIDVNNKFGDETVTLLPNPKSTYTTGQYENYTPIYNDITSTWNVNTRPLRVEDILKIVSTDIMKSLLIRSGISDSIIGNLNYTNRMNTEINKLINYNGYYQVENEKFEYLTSNNCYWASNEYNISKGFAIKKINETNSKIYGEDKTGNCNVIPVIIADKENL